MNRVVILRWEKLIAPCLLIALIIGIVFYIEADFGDLIQTSVQQDDLKKIYIKPERPPQGSLEELYQDIFMTMLLPYINKAVDDYYEENTGYSPTVDTWQPVILYIERPNGDRTSLFIIKLEVTPYLGAHNSIGVDHITFRVSYGEVKVEKFEHIKSYPVPPWLQ